MKKILIIEDEPEMIDLIQLILTRRGFEVAGATGGMEGLTLVREKRPDLVLLDLMMPQPTGFQLCRMLRATPGFKFTPIIIITALDDTDSKLVAFGAGANDYLTKPFHVGELMEKMKEFLE